MKISIKILATVTLVSMLLACLCPAVLAAESATTLTVTSAEVTAERGETVEVTLYVTENPGFAGLRITVEEKDGFTVESVTNGTVMRTMTSGKNILWDDSKNSTATGALVTIKYTVENDAPVGRNTIQVTLRECYNAKLERVTVSLAPIVVNVLAPEGEESSSEESTTAPIETDSTEAPTTSETESATTETTTEAPTTSETESATTETTTEAPTASETESVTTETTTEAPTASETESNTTQITTEAPSNEETETAPVEDETGSEGTIESESTIESECTSESEIASESESEPAATPSGNLVIEIEEVSAAKGDVVKVILKVTENPGFCGLIITVPEIEGFELRDVANGTVMDTMTPGVNILWDSLSDSTKTGTLVTLTYLVTDDAPVGNNSATVKVRECSNANGENVEVVIGQITINVADSEGNTTEAPDDGNDGADAGNGCAGGCSGEIGVGAIIVTTLLAGAWFFRKKH